MNEDDLSQSLLVAAEEEVQQQENDDDADEVDTQEEEEPCENDESNIPEGNRNPWKNRNVLLSLLLCIVSGTADSIWATIVLSGFLLALGDSMGQEKHDNTLVGAAEAVQGLTQLVTALPVGIVADVYGKSKVVRGGGALMLFTIGLTLWALVDVKNSTNDDDSSNGDKEEQAAATVSYYIMVTALGLWGIVSGISYGPGQALYADSIPQGQRSKMLTWLYTCYLLSSSTGPIVSIILLLTVARNTEDWSINEIFPVFCVGILLEIPAAIIMFFFSDKHVIHEEVQSPPSSSSSPPSPDHQAHHEGETATTTSSPQTNIGDDDSTSNVVQSHSRCCSTRSSNLVTKACIPYFVFLSGLVISLGAGASVKYFPLFFKELGLTQAAVQALYLVSPLFISGLSFVAQRTSRTVGRIETSIGFYFIGVSLLYYLTFLSQSIPTNVVPSDDDTNSTNTTTLIWLNDESDDDSNNNTTPTTPTTTLWQENPMRVVWIVIIWWFRTGLMNSVYPLLESVLMDVVPSNQRARWKSLESIAAFGWTGSALVGGILSDTHSYQFTFVTTATLQLTGALLLIPIRPLVELERSIEEEQNAAAEEASTVDSENSDDDSDPESTAPNTTPMPSEPQANSNGSAAAAAALRQPLLQNDTAVDPS